MTTHLTSWELWFIYFLGQAFSILWQGQLSLNSKLNGVNTWGVYFKLRAIPIACRVFLTTCSFVIVWNNPSLMDLSGKMFPSAGAQTALAGILGWGSDSLWDHVVAILPGFNKELPPPKQEPPS